MTYSSIAWELIKWLLGGVVLSGIIYEVILRKVWNPIWAFMRAGQVTKSILKQNRPTRNGGGKYTADRMLDLWNNGQPLPLVSRHGVIYKAAGRWPSAHWENVIDGLLEKEGLVLRYEQEGRSLVKLTDSMLTRFVMSRLLRKVEQGIL